jgi:hypothetical protein
VSEGCFPTPFLWVENAQVGGFLPFEGRFCVLDMLNNAKNASFWRCGEKKVSSKTCYSAENA